jgi:hypothetical protein
MCCIFIAMRPIFEPIEAPPHHLRFARKHDARWYTWSTDFQQEYMVFKKHLSKAPTPKLIFLKNHESYNYTYSIGMSKVDKSLITDLKPFVLALYHFDPQEHLNIFSGMINRNISGIIYHKIIALCRGIIVGHQKDPMAALYAPLTPGKDQSDFPLHCDLYIPKFLFNVFGQVASDGSGRSTFLALGLFFELLETIHSMPEDVKKQIKQIFTTELQVDYFDTLYRLLYDKGNKWSPDVKKTLYKARISIGLQKGEGYMINDRIWMHGREKTSGGISRKRLHRLIYSNI